MTSLQKRAIKEARAQIDLAGTAAYRASVENDKTKRDSWIESASNYILNAQGWLRTLEEEKE